MGFFTAAAATGAAALGTYMQGQAQADAAKAQAKLGERNAVVAEKNARASELKGGFDRIRAVLQGDRNMASKRVGVAHSGARLDSDAAIRLFAEQANEDEIQVALTGYNAKTRTDQYRSKAAGFRAGAKYADIRADNIQLATTINTGSSLLGDIGAMYDQDRFTSATPA